MSHSVKITLIANQIIALDNSIHTIHQRKEINIHDLSWIEVNEDGCIIDYGLNVPAPSGFLPCGHHKDALVENAGRQWCVVCERDSL